MKILEDIGIVLDGTDSTYQSIDVSDVPTFINYLHLIVSPLFKNRGDRDHLVFRGQGDANWGLVPSAMRDDKESYEKLLEWVPGASRDFKFQEQDHRRDFEWETVLRFANELEKSGQPLPGVPSGFRDSQSIESNANLTLDFPPDGTRELFAFAQHHGVPTRLLDWSHSHLHACYFAACDAAAKNKMYPSESKDNRLAVWVLSLNFVRKFLSCQMPNSVFLITPATHTNPNLRRQHGLFTYATSRFPVLNNLPIEHDLKKIIEPFSYEFLSKLDRGFCVGPQLVRITLPVSEANYLMYYLSSLNITATSVYEGVDACARSVLEQRLYQRR